MPSGWRSASNARSRSALRQPAASAGSPSSPAPLCCAPTGLPRVYAELGHVLLAVGHAASMRSSAYQPGPTYGNRLRQGCLASQQPSTKPRSGSTPSTGSTPSAGGRGRWSLLCLQRTTSTPTYVLSFAHVCASKTRGGSLELRTARRRGRRPCRAGRQVRAVRLRADGRHLRAGPRGAGKAGLCGQRADFAGWRWDAPAPAHEGLRSVSFQPCEEDVLPSAFEDKPLCVSWQLAELLQLSVEEVCANFDAMLRHDWRRLGISVPCCAAQLVHRQPVPALVARPRVPPAAPPG